MPGMPRVRAIGRSLYFGDVGQQLVVESGMTRPRLREALQTTELVNPDRRLNIAQVVFESGREDLIKPIAFVRVAGPTIFGNSVQTEDAEGLSQTFVVGRNHTALTGCQVLGGVEAED